MTINPLQIIEDPANPDELLLDLGTELCTELGWQAGDTVQWIDNKDGTWQLTKSQNQLTSWPDDYKKADGYYGAISYR